MIVDCCLIFFGGLGRVNLIGEHIDYEGYSVLPMAIRQDTIVAIRKRSEDDEKILRIANLNDMKYSMCTYPADPHQVHFPFTLLFFFLIFFLHCALNYLYISIM